MTPRRIQRRRTKGWRMQDAAGNGLPTVCVGRPGPYGNPYYVTAERDLLVIDPYAVESAADATAKFRADLLAGKLDFTIEDIRRDLAGKNICCWCREDDPYCHGDVLLELANRENPT